MSGPEAKIERYLVSQVEKHGGLCLKWTGRKDVPDRLVFMNGLIVPVELKSATGRLSEGQVRMHSKIWQTGNEVMLISSTQQVDKLVDSIVMYGYCECKECTSLRAGALN